jgi:exopolysaccharide biosynthesis polyprenyl glycosylphosphotransferase
MQNQNIRRKLAIKVREIFDLLIMTACFLLALYVRYRDAAPTSFGDFLCIRVQVINFVVFMAFLLVWHSLFSLFGLYRSRRLSSMRGEILDVLKATFAGSTILFALGSAFKLLTVTTFHFIALFWAASTIGTVSTRLTVRLFLRALRLKGRNSRHLLIAGTNRRAVEYARKIESRPELGYRIVGFVENGWSGNGEFRQSGYSVVTGFETFPDFIRTHVIDEVMVCLPMKSQYELASRLVKLCEEQGIIVRFLSDFFDLELARSSAEMVDGNSVITLSTGAIQGWAVLVKRAIDLLVSLVLLLLLAPMFGVIAVFIKLTSPGPVFFVQERVGLNKRKFRLYKFRTMVPEAEKMRRDLEKLNEVSGPVFKIKNDPRITWIGRYLRRLSVDELPQLINVLRGDMSLVGPRPPLPSEVGKYDLPYLRRLSMKPGITCLWQVNGRNSIAFNEWMELDQQYIDQWSLWMDVKILVRTIPAVLRGSGE